MICALNVYTANTILFSYFVSTFSKNYSRYDSATKLECSLKASPNFVFDSWSTNFNMSSNSLTNASQIFKIPYYKTSITANLRQAFPDAVNNIALIIILPAVAAWLLPFFVDIFSQKRQRKHLSKYLDETYRKYDNSKEVCTVRRQGLKEKNNSPFCYTKN